MKKTKSFDWLTIDEASKKLDCSNIEVLRLALQGSLKISIRIITPTIGRRGDLVTYKQFESKQSQQHFSHGLNKFMGVSQDFFLCEGGVWIFGNSIETLEGIYDLPMIGGERYYVEQEYFKTAYGQEKHFPESQGIFVENDSGQIYQLFRVADEADFVSYEENEKHEWPYDERDNTYFPLLSLPTNTELIIRYSSIDKLKGLSKTKSSISNEINSLLKIICTMAVKGYSYDPSENKSKTPGEIVNDADELGVSINIATVRKWLKEATDSHLSKN